MRIVLIAIAFAGLASGSVVQTQTCEQIVDSSLQRINWFYRPIVKQNTLEIIKLMNTGRLTEGSARIYVASKLRKFSKNEKWIIGVSREFIAQVQKARKIEACKNYSIPQSEHFAQSPD
jgi:hypothetical protein